MELEAVRVDIPERANVIIGQTHFIKTAEDLYEVVAASVPQAKFGVAFNEASGPCLIRKEGNEAELLEACVRNLQAIGAGHVFMIMLREAFPINVLNAVKNCPEVCRVFCATANPVEVIVTATAQGRAVLGVVDGAPPRGVETAQDAADRRDFLRTIGYKL